MENFIVHLTSASKMLPKQQRTLCEFILGNMLESSAMTISQLSEASGVATSTVIRTIQSLGYEGFNAFKDDLRRNALLREGGTYSSFMNLMKKETVVGAYKQKLGLAHVMQSMEDAVHKLNNPAFIDLLSKAVDMLVAADNIYVLGLRSAAPVALYFEAILFNSNKKVIQLSTQPEYIYDRLFEMTANDVLLASGGHPIVKKTSEAIRICYDRDIKTIVVGNSKDLPIGRYATLMISTDTMDAPIYGTPGFMVMELLSREFVRRTGSKDNSTSAIDTMLNKYGVSIWDK